MDLQRSGDGKGGSLFGRVFSGLLAFSVAVFALASFAWLGWDLVALFQGRDLIAESQTWFGGREPAGPTAGGEQDPGVEGGRTPGAGQVQVGEPRGGHTGEPGAAPGTALPGARFTLARPAVEDSTSLAGWGQYGMGGAGAVAALLASELPPALTAIPAAEADPTALAAASPAVVGPGPGTHPSPVAAATAASGETAQLTVLVPTVDGGQAGAGTALGSASPAPGAVAPVSDGSAPVPAEPALPTEGVAPVPGVDRPLPAANGFVPASGGSPPAHESLSPRPDGLAPAPSGLPPAPDASPSSLGAPAGNRPRLAIVIDDWGYPWAAADSLLDFPAPLTVAVIPRLPLSEEHARRAAERGHEVLLHLPMEPLNASASALEPDTILVDMSPVEILAAVDKALKTVPTAVGVNNHMGSRATADPGVMHPLLADLGRRGLFFLDSQTTPRSVAAQAAAAHRVPLAVNRIFLDHDASEEAVVRQVRKAIALAREEGEAIAIGHVRPGTYRALVRTLPEIEAAGIQLVPVSRLARRLPAPDRFRRGFQRVMAALGAEAAGGLVLAREGADLAASWSGGGPAGRGPVGQGVAGDGITGRGVPGGGINGAAGPLGKEVVADESLRGVQRTAEAR